MRVSELLDTPFRRADFLLQPFVCLSRELFDERPGAPPSGELTREQWGAERHSLTVGAGEDRYASDASYLRYLTAIRGAKIDAVHALMREFDFARYPRVIELGCGDMPQACTIAASHPGIAYKATDFDPVVIERCSKLAVLAKIEKAVLDARTDLEALAGHDLVASWSLEFSLDDTELERLFAACRREAIPYLLCTHAAVGPLALARSPRKSNASGRRLGWLRSVGEIARIARRGGMRLTWKRYHVNHASLFFTP